MTFLSRKTAEGWKNDVKLWYHSSFPSGFYTVSGKKKNKLHPQISIFKVTARWQIKRIPIGIFKKMFSLCCHCTLLMWKCGKYLKQICSTSLYVHSWHPHWYTVCTYTRLSSSLQGCEAMLLMWNTRAEPTWCLTEEVSTVDHWSPCRLLSPRWSATQLPGESEMPSCQSTSCLTFKLWSALNITLPDGLLLVWAHAMKKDAHRDVPLFWSFYKTCSALALRS